MRESADPLCARSVATDVECRDLDVDVGERRLAVLDLDGKFHRRLQAECRRRHPHVLGVQIGNDGAVADDARLDTSNQRAACARHCSPCRPDLVEMVRFFALRSVLPAFR